MPRFSCSLEIFRFLSISIPNSSDAGSAPTAPFARLARALPILLGAPLVAGALGCEPADAPAAAPLSDAALSAASTTSDPAAHAFYSTYFPSGASGPGVDAVGVEVLGTSEVRVFFCGGASTVTTHTKWLRGTLVGTLEDGTASLHEGASAATVTTVHFAGDAVDGVVVREDDPTNPHPATWMAKRVHGAPWAGLYENAGFEATEHQGLIVGVFEGTSRYWWQGAAIFPSQIELVDPIGGRSTPTGRVIDVSLPSQPGVTIALTPVASLQSGP